MRHRLPRPVTVPAADGRRLRQAALALAGAAVTAAALLPAAARAAQLEPTIIPTVHPTLTPTSAIPSPLRFSADETSVWRADADQRMLLTGHVTVNVGYRTLRADGAAVWLTPSREAGENTLDVAIYLSGNVDVREGTRAAATTTVGKELLVTTRVSQGVLLTGNPVSKAEEDSPLVKRGNEIRAELLNRPAAAAFVPPRIVITPAEEALQAGWIARGPNNRIIAGPGDIVARGPDGRVIPGAARAATRPARPRPSIFATGDDVRGQQEGDELITVVPGAYLLYDGMEGRPPIEFRAQRMVIFSPAQPATRPGAGQPAANDLSTVVTGVYMEGDVTLDQGDQLMVRAERIYYDFVSKRAVMLDATLSTVDEKRNIPLYLRAAEIRQLARGEFAAKKVTFSTSEFFTPHYHIGASEVYLRDITPQLGPAAGAGDGGGGGGSGGGDFDLGLASGGGGDAALRTYEFKARDATINAQGLPIFYWPYLAGDTSKNEIPLRTIRVSNSRTFGLSLLTDWDIFGLAGQREPDGVRADLNLDYFGKRGPGAGVQSAWTTDEDHGLLRTYALMEQGTDRLGRDREDVLPQQDTRGRATFRDQRDLGDGLTLQVEASYISDPTFLEQFFQHEFDTDKEQETSVYLKKQGETDALTLLGKFNLLDFTATADRIDDQFTTEKKPEIKYWRVGDSFFDLFTYYSESGFANVSSDITNYTPAQLGFLPEFLAPPAGTVPSSTGDPVLDRQLYLSTTFRNRYRALGWTTGDVLRGDTRHELDMPLQFGDLKVVPYVTGRVTAWDDAFPETESGSTTRVWGGGGIRSSMQFWHVYEDVHSTFWDVHRLRHIVEPQFNVFAGGGNKDRGDLQPFDRDVEGMSTASGTQLSINQKWQTKRGGEGHWRNVDWITLNVSWNQFYNTDKASVFFPQQSLRGFYFTSRPELSLVQNSIAVDGVWRVGERFRFIGEANFNLDEGRVSQFATGVAVDQNPSLSYFFGNRYVRLPLSDGTWQETDEWTVAVDYQLTKKYQVIAAESYDFGLGDNILSSITLLRRMPRFNTALTVTYDANNADTSFVFTAWPEGFPNTGFANRTGGRVDR